MFGYRGFQQILWFLLAQIVTLSLCFVFAALLFTSALTSGAASGTGAIAMGLFVLAAFLFVLRMAWPVGIERVELLWGTSAKVRVERWLEPALLWAGLATVLAAVLTLFANISPILSGLGFLVAALAAAVPLALSLLLLTSALRRQKGYQSAIEEMQSTLSGDGLERVQASVANEAGQIETTVKPNPQGFTFAGIASKPWHDPADFPWVAGFEDAVDKITEEAELVLKIGDRVTNYDYVGLDGDFWKSFKFVARHKPIEENLAACPTTAALLRTVPGYPAFRDAMFSILDGGGIIKPHRDVSNVFLTLHLPLIAPPNGTIEVGGLKRTWERGKPLIFDSSYHHQAINPSDEARVILLVDFLHPELSEEERRWVSEMRL